MAIPGVPTADQAEAEQGTIDDKAMTPLRTRQAFDADREWTSKLPYLNTIPTSLDKVLGSYVELSQFGVKADSSINDFGSSGTDMTSVLEDIFVSGEPLTDRVLKMPEGVIKCQYLTIRDQARLSIIWDNTALFAVGTEARPEFVRFHNLQSCRMRGLRLYSDGNRPATNGPVLYADNYKSAIRWTTDTMDWRTENGGEWMLNPPTPDNKYHRPMAVSRGVVNYRCNLEHTPSAANRPGDGTGNWLQYWWPLPADSGPEWKKAPGTSNYSAWNWFDDFEVRGWREGIVYGARPEDPNKQQPEAQDSNLFTNCQFRNIMKPVSANCHNTGLDFQGCHFDMNRSSWRLDSDTGFWNDGDRWLCRNDNEDKQSRIQFWNSRRLCNTENTGAYGLYGKDINWIGGADEFGATHYVTGDMIDSGHQRGFIGSTTAPVYQLAPDSAGKLLVANREFRRRIMGDPATTTDIMFIEGKNDDSDDPGNTTQDVVLENLMIMDIQFNPTGATGDKRFFVRGGRSLDMQNVELRGDDAATSFRFNLSKTSLFTTADPRGDTMSTTQDTSTKGGWSLVTGLSGGHFCKQTSSPPPGQSAFIEFASNGALGVVSTPTGTSGFRVTGGRDHLLSFWLKLITGVGQFSWYVKWYDFSGSLIGSSTQVFNLNQSAGPHGEFTDMGFDHWQMGYAPLKAPSNASFAALEVRPGTTAIKIGIGDVQVR